MTGRQFATALRRIITAVNASGKSVVGYDGPPCPIIEFGGGAVGLYDAWVDSGGALERSAPVPTHPDDVVLSPPPRGVKLRWFTVAPATGPRTPEQEQFYKNAFAAIGAADHRPDTTRHPAMHLTHTLDFIIVIEGSVRLLLDADERLLAPGDIVVQRGTNHAWICEGDKPALLVAVLIDKAFADA